MEYCCGQDGNTGIASIEMIKNHAIAGWEAFELRSASLAGQVRYIRRDLAAGGLVTDIDVAKFKRAPGCGLRQYQQFDVPEGTREKSEESAVLINPRYATRLSRRIGSEQWVVVAGDSDLSNGASKELTLAEESSTAYANLATSLTSRKHYLLQMLKSGQMQFSGCEKTNVGGRELIRVTCIVTNDVLKSGWILLDPTHYWVVVGFEFSSVEDSAIGTMAGKYTYKYTDGFPVLTEKRLRNRGTADQATYDIENTYHVTLEYRPVGKDEFELEAFGITPPSELASQGSYTWLWFFLIGIIVFSVSFVALRYKYFGGQRACIALLPTQSVLADEDPPPPTTSCPYSTCQYNCAYVAGTCQSGGDTFHVITKPLQYGECWCSPFNDPITGPFCACSIAAASGPGVESVPLVPFFYSLTDSVDLLAGAGRLIVGAAAGLPCVFA